MGEDIDNYKCEIEKLENQLKEKEIIAEKNKEYLFVLEHQMKVKNERIDGLTYKCNKLEKENKQVKNLKNEINSLKNKNNQLSNELKIMKSTVSWKITKPIRKIKKLL